MARAPDWHHAPMAKGDPAPRWPLPGHAPKFANWSFGGGRPFGCNEDSCERWHAGIDLTKIPDGALVIAPEDATVIALDRGWSAGSKAQFLKTASGLFLVLGGFQPGSHREFDLSVGQSIKKGQKLGRVLGSYGMIHLETYGFPSDRKANTVWRVGNPIPGGLLNPTKYVESMVGDAPQADAATPSTDPTAPPVDAAAPPTPAPNSRTPWVLGALALTGAAVALTYALHARRTS
jgi:murein DD-endopeptidase MepM/ murein hydrolase activator NlpD